MIESAEIVVIGAGFAGASTAYHLVKSGVADVLVLEAEDLPGMHSSGRNASMARQTIEDPSIAALAAEGTRFLWSPPEEWREAGGLIKANGSLLLASRANRASLETIRENCTKLGVEVEIVSAEESRRRVPVLSGADFEQAAWCPTDGLVDIHALLMGYLAGVRGGGRVNLSRPVTAIRARAGRIVGVETTQGPVEARWVVNASGAWAADLAVRSGLPGMPLRSFRRHLFVTPPMPWVDPTWPFVWDITHSIYFRPEGNSLLMSPCDHDEMPACDVAEDPKQREFLAKRVMQYMPGLAEVPLRSGWAGLRTFAPDNRFVIGVDPGIEGLVWVTALGGHGMTTSASVGRLAASVILANGETGPFSPARFASKQGFARPHGARPNAEA